MNYYHYKYSESSIDIINMAFNSVSSLELIEYLTLFEPDPKTGFMWCENLVIKKILDKVNSDWDGHSGASLGFSVRELSTLLKYNHCVNEFIEYLNKSNMLNVFKNYTPPLDNYENESDEFVEKLFGQIKKLNFNYVIDDYSQFLLNVKNKLN